METQSAVSHSRVLMSDGPECWSNCQGLLQQIVTPRLWLFIVTMVRVYTQPGARGLSTLGGVYGGSGYNSGKVRTGSLSWPDIVLFYFFKVFQLSHVRVLLVTTIREFSSISFVSLKNIFSLHSIFTLFLPSTFTFFSHSSLFACGCSHPARPGPRWCMRLLTPGSTSSRSLTTGSSAMWLSLSPLRSTLSIRWRSPSRSGSVKCVGGSTGQR